MGDFPIEVGGMDDKEAKDLLHAHAKRLGILSLLTDSYQRKLIDEAEGHPYVMKILLGQAAKEGQAVNPTRIIGSSGELLTALFERTYSILTPAAQRVFLLLGSWRVFVPEVAVEAVALRPGNERFDVRGALDDLRRYSLIEHVPSEEEAGEDFVGVPLPAAIFGMRKLDTNPYRIEIEEDRKLLMEFGPAKRQDVKAGIMPRVSRLVREIAKRANANTQDTGRMLTILEYIAGRVPQVYLLLAQLVREVDESAHSLEQANSYLDRFLEGAQPKDRTDVWMDKANIYRQQEDVAKELHSLAEAALSAGTPDTTGGIVNRINNRLRELGDRKSEVLHSLGVRQIVASVAEHLHKRLDHLSATDCSRLAWLMLNLGDEERARDVTKRGFDKDPENDHCRRLVERLQI